MNVYLAGLDSPNRQAAQTERVLAVGRAFLTVTGLVAIFLDPTEPARLRELTYGVLLGYAVYSLGVLAYVNNTARITPWHGQLLHGLDIGWTSALTFVSEGPVSPFFLFFLFVVLAAAYRWRLRETVGTAAIIIVIFLIETLVATSSPWHATWLSSIAFDLHGTILRVTYLLLTGVLLGYLAEQEKRSRAELAAIASAARQPQVHLGLGGSVGAIARVLMSTFDAAAVAIVVRDAETRRSLLWQLDAAAEHPRRTELRPEQQETWLFEDDGRAWQATAANHEREPNIRVTEPEAWHLQRGQRPLPRTFMTARPFTNVTAINMGLAKEWQARAYLYDIRDGGPLERRLHFLEQLADHITPALTNVLLLRRLRSRAGAAERARVARELHDGAIQALFGIAMRIEAIRRESDRTSAVDTELGEIQELLTGEAQALRDLMQALRPSEVDSSDQLPEVLAGLVERFRRTSGISARFIAAPERISLAPARALEIARIVQEALVNVRKHSRARNVLVRLSQVDRIYNLVIEDDGRGFEFEGRLSAGELDQRRVGPAIIKERARIAGAQLAVDSTPGAGARLELSFSEDAYA